MPRKTLVNLKTIVNKDLYSQRIKLSNTITNNNKESRSYELCCGHFRTLTLNFFCNDNNNQKYRKKQPCFYG